ncbi:hypothetical protein Vafri_14360, partial [Volvox africanus]
PPGFPCCMYVLKQCLSGCRHFSKPCVSLKHSGTCPLKAAGSGPCACCALERQLREMLVSADGTALSPDEVVSVLHHISPAFEPGMQQDAQEFWVKLLEMLGEEASMCTLLRSSAAADASAHQAIRVAAAAAATGEPKQDLGSVECTDQIFTGVCQNGRRCMRCQHVTTLGAAEDYKTLMLPIDMANSVAEALDNHMNQGSFDTKHYCTMCGSFEDAKPAVSLLSVPDVLVLALKRFENSEMGDRFGRSKINNHVEFSTTVNLQPFMLPGHSGPGEATYDLAGIMVHAGDLDGGHYVAYIRGNGGSWWYKDDECAVEVPLEEVLAQKAYMLFYERTVPEQANLQTTITAITTTTSLTTTSTTTSSYVTAHDDCFDLSTSTTSSGAISDTAAAATVHGYWHRAAAAGGATSSSSLHAATMTTAATTVTTTAAPDDPTADTAASRRRRCTHRRQRGCIAATPLPPRPAHAVMAQPTRKRLASSLPCSDDDESSDGSLQQGPKKPRTGGFMSFKWLIGDYFSSVGSTFHRWTGALV